MRGKPTASSQENHRNRYLSQRNGFFTYKRRVPTSVAALDARSPFIRIALHTDDLAKARTLRDAHERADDDLWASLLAGGERAIAEAQFKAAQARARALGFSYRSPSEILIHDSPETIEARLKKLLALKPASHEETAVLGGVDRPRPTVTEAFDIYVEQIAAAEVRGKSKQQRKQWEKVKRRAVNNFVAIVADKPIDEITRDDALKVHEYWRARIAPKSGKPTASPSSGNRDLGNMRVLFDAYFAHIGVKLENPFNGLFFSQKFKKKRPPFPVEWIKEKILAPGALKSLNPQARGIMLVVMETGARPSEIANLRPEQIRLDHAVPHISIEPQDDPEDPREIKTVSSIRMVPLIGVALEVMKKFPKGFPRYKNNENSLSACLNKYFRTNHLLPSPQHKPYSLRHSFEDRMKVANIDSELRMILMGHKIDRPEYGEGGTLTWRRDELAKIALPFDPTIV